MVENIEGLEKCIWKIEAENPNCERFKEIKINDDSIFGDCKYRCDGYEVQCSSYMSKKMYDLNYK